MYQNFETLNDLIEYLQELAEQETVGGIGDDLDHIADLIDAEHQKACDDAWDNGYEADYLGIESWLTEHPQVMEKHGWVKLPKDADGEVIHIGDVLTDDAEFKSEGVVERLMLDESGWFVGFGKGWTDTKIHEWHHYHEPTVDDLLFSYGQACIRASNESETEAAKQTMLASLRHEYAAKLRIADDRKE